MRGANHNVRNRQQKDLRNHIAQTSWEAYQMYINTCDGAEGVAEEVRSEDFIDVVEEMDD